MKMNQLGENITIERTQNSSPPEDQQQGTVLEAEISPC
jgi:hypothetical protein